MTLPLIVALTLGGVGVYVAYRNPKLGVALMVGLAIITTLYIIWEKDPSVFQTGDIPASSTVPTPSGSAATQPAPPAASPSSQHS